MKVIDVLTDNGWTTQEPTKTGQRVRETTYLPNGGISVIEYVFVTEPVVDMRITKLAFKQRFTQAERIAIREAAKVSPLVYDFEDLVNSATFVDLSREDTDTAVFTLEKIGLIATGRASEILTTEPQEHELFQRQ